MSCVLDKRALLLGNAWVTFGCLLDSYGGQVAFIHSLRVNEFLESVANKIMLGLYIQILGSMYIQGGEIKVSIVARSAKRYGYS